MKQKLISRILIISNFVFLQQLHDHIQYSSEHEHGGSIMESGEIEDFFHHHQHLFNK